MNKSPCSLKKVQEVIVRLIILYLLFWLVTFKVKVFASPYAPNQINYRKKTVEINSGTAIFTVFSLTV